MTAAITLEALLGACQRSMARANHAAEQAWAASTELISGEAALLVVKDVRFELCCGVSVDAPDQPLNAEAVVVDLSRSESRMVFTIEQDRHAVPPDGALIVADLDALGVAPYERHLRITAIDEDGSVLPGLGIAVVFVGPDREDLLSVDVRLGPNGQTDLTLRNRTTIELNGMPVSETVPDEASHFVVACPPRGMRSRMLSLDRGGP